MPYPKRLLNEGEAVALDLKPHWWYFSRQVLTGIPLFVLLVVQIKFSDTFEEVGWWIWGVLAVGWAAWLGTRYLAWTFTQFVVTSDRVVFRTGVVAKRGVEVPLERINNINFRQGVWERLIGAGDLEIESAGKDGQSVFNNVNHPDGVQQEVYRQMETNAKKRASWSTGGAAATAAEASIPEQIHQLADLHERGVITDEEFEAKKAQLLERM